MRLDARDVLWFAVGAALLVVLSVVIIRFRDERTFNEQLALRTRRVELVGRMGTSLASAAEAEKSAVLAVTDEESRTFADRARALDADVDQARQELTALLERTGTQEEKDAAAQFGEAFADLRRIDAEILDLAVKNTNLKAAALTYGPATDAVRALGAALAPIEHTAGEANAGATATDTVDAPRLAARAEIAALEVLTMLSPHIAEQSDQKMTEMEAQMARREQDVRTALDGLASVPGYADRPDVAAARAAWTRFAELKAQIIGLSRENTNVRSLDMSLTRKRKVLAVCQSALATLQRALEAEHVGGATSGRWAIPR